ncbi:hypothetical protein [Streptomyces sp. NPDC059786]|uniref:DUF6197 family protein n=1 Tax=Streptomyces sp. NPDC059786 TaxID=3346946 RepID=UPI00365F129B
MTAPTRTETAVAPAELDLEARLLLLGAVMEERVTQAGLAFEVNTAHLPSTEPIPEITAPPPLITTAPPCPYPTPLAAVLYRARIRLEAGGWCTGQLYADGAACLMGAIRAEAAGRAEADDACVLLLEAIRRDFPHAETIPSWNDPQPNSRLPLLYLDRAAALAHARSI